MKLHIDENDIVAVYSHQNVRNIEAGVLGEFIKRKKNSGDIQPIQNLYTSTSKMVQILAESPDDPEAINDMKNMLRGLVTILYIYDDDLVIDGGRRKHRIVKPEETDFDKVPIDGYFIETVTYHKESDEFEFPEEDGDYDE